MSEHKDRRIDFRSTAEAYRGRRRMVVIAALAIGCVYGAFVLLLATGSRQHPHPPLLRIPLTPFIPAAFLVVAIVAAIVVNLKFLALPCPECGGNLDRMRALNFCPCCGEARVEKRFLLGPICRACNTSLRRGKGGRTYKTRYCPNCGCFVDDGGV